MPTWAERVQALIKVGLIERSTGYNRGVMMYLRISRCRLSYRWESRIILIIEKVVDLKRRGKIVSVRYLLWGP
jgi:hypothetical protein